MLKPDEEQSFFDRERDRLTGEIATVRAFLFLFQIFNVSRLPSRATNTCQSLQTNVSSWLFTVLSFHQGFEELLSSSNVLNRRLEEVLGMTREYDTIASLWGSFHELMKGQKDVVSLEEQPLGLPGTGGHVVVSSSKQQDGGGK
jgi:DASH complex subunit DAD1